MDLLPRRACIALTAGATVRLKAHTTETATVRLHADSTTLATVRLKPDPTRFGSVRLQPDPQQGKPRGSEFVFARLRYDSGDWDYNPKAAANVLDSVMQYTSIPVYQEEVVISASSDELLSFPFVFMTGYQRESIDRRYANVPMLQKPIDAAALEAVLLTLLGSEPLLRAAEG